MENNFFFVSFLLTAVADTSLVVHTDIFLYPFIMLNITILFCASGDCHSAHQSSEVSERGRYRARHRWDDWGWAGWGWGGDWPCWKRATQRPDPLVQRPQPHPDSGAVCVPVVSLPWPHSLVEVVLLFYFPWIPKQLELSSLSKNIVFFCFCFFAWSTSPFFLDAF